jgi:polyisoprenoid-binding protein YceI
VLVVVVGALGFWWFVLRDDAPERAALPVRTEGTEPAAPGTAAATPDPDGTWRVVPGEEVFAGYRIEELFGGETVKKTAVGRTRSVTGTMEIAGGVVTSARVTADLTALTSDSARRDETQRTQGLQTDQFPEATFTLTEPIDLGEPPAPGSPVTVTATGDLTLHGVTRPVTLELQASWTGTVIDVAGGTRIVLADFAIEPPRNPFVTVDDVGEFEVQLSFERAP